MSNKTNIFTDDDLNGLTLLFNEIQKSDGAAGVKLREEASINYVNNGCNLKRMEDFTAECWTLAILTRINVLGYDIKKRE